MSSNSHRRPFRFWMVSAVVPLLCVSVVAAANPTDWSQFRGPGGLGVSSDKGLPITWSETENVAWKIELPGAGTSSPILVGNRIFLTCYSGFGIPNESGGSIDDLKRHVVCLNRADGKTLWTRDVKSVLPEQERIREDHGYASNTPVADAERLFVFFGKSGVLAFDHSGKQLWQADVGSKLNGWGSAASLVLSGDLVIVNASIESESLVALNKKTGKEVWRAEGIKESWNTPLLVSLPAGKTELVVAIFGKILGFDPATGEQLWSCATDIGWYMVPSLVAENGVVYCIGGRSGGALAVKLGGRGDVTNSHRIWTGRKGSNVSSPIFHQGHLYWMNDNLGIAYCADGKTGEIIYEERVTGAGQTYASPVLADGKIYQVSRNGRAFVLAAKPSFELLATNTLGDRRSIFNTPPVVSGSRIYLRSNQFLYCLEAK